MATPYDLPFVQNERFERGFRYKIDGVARPMTAYEWRGQVRQKESTAGALVLDLNAYLAIDEDDDTLLLLDVPATVTREMPKLRETAAWDIFIWPTGEPENAICLIEGAATLDLSTTAFS